MCCFLSSPSSSPLFSIAIPLIECPQGYKRLNATRCIGKNHSLFLFIFLYCSCMHTCYFVFMCSCNGHVCIFVVQHIFATRVCVVMHRLWWFLIRCVSKCVLFTYFIQFEPHWLLHVTTGHIHHILFLLLHCHFKTVSQIYPREDFLSPLWGETGGIFDRSF